MSPAPSLRQLGVAARRHYPALAAPKLQYAHDPPLQLARPLDVSFGIIQDTTVAYERATLRDSNDLAERDDTVLLRRGRPSSTLPKASDAFG